MSAGLVCDQCGTTLIVNSRGDSDTGEEAGWLSITTTFGSYDLCTRACAVALLDSPDFVAQMDEGAQVIAEIANTIREGREDGIP